MWVELYFFSTPAAFKALLYWSISTVWTTNFDSLTVKAASDFQVTPIEIGLDTVDRLERVSSKG